MAQHLRRLISDRSNAHRKSARRLSKPTDRVHLLRHLQGQAGNRAVTQLAQQWVIQPKLTVTPAGDVYEQEADRIANQVLQQIGDGAGSREVQRQEEEEEEMQMQREAQAQRQEIPEEEEEMMMQRDLSAQRQEISEEEEALQMQPDGTMQATASLTTAVEDAKGNGHTLSQDTRKPLERAFGTNFNSVRIHADSQADRLSRAMQARAFTVGADIFFRQNAYAPQSASGQKLLAHELTHVIQQGFAPTQREIDEETSADQG